MAAFFIAFHTAEILKGLLIKGFVISVEFIPQIERLKIIFVKFSE